MLTNFHGGVPARVHVVHGVDFCTITEMHRLRNVECIYINTHTYTNTYNYMHRIHVWYIYLPTLG